MTISTLMSGIVRQEPLECRPEHRLCRVFRACHPDRASRLIPQLANGLQLGVDLGEARADGLRISRSPASVGDNMAGCTGQQPDAQTCFQTPDRLAER